MFERTGQNKDGLRWVPDRSSDLNGFTEAINDGVLMATPRSLWQRIMDRLFPFAPRPEIVGDKRTYITTDIRITIDWKDRIRMLVLGAARVQVRTYTDVLVNEAQSVSTFSVEY
jgi:hypothetical protein